jgi:hypothetical protein
MSTITTLRPSGLSSGTGWTATPSGTLYGVTSDDSDVTYALWSGTGAAMILTTPVDSPPAGERRHQARIRMRGEDGDAWGAVRLASGALIAGAVAQFSTSPGTVTGAWGTGLPADGPSILSTYVTGQTSSVKLEELYLDVDTRLSPSFTLTTLDGSGAASATISDTVQPVVSVGTPDLDDLTARQYRYWVTLNGAIMWDTGIVSGPATDRQTAALDNGSYVAHAIVWSTLGQNTEYPSDEQTFDFTISVGLVPAPDNPTVTPVTDTPFYSIQACAPFTGEFDDDQGYLEIQRVDCPNGGYLNLIGSDFSSASATPAIGPLSNLEITAYAARDDDWLPDKDEAIASHFDTGGDQRAWWFGITTGGLPVIRWSEDGTSSLLEAIGTDRVPFDGYGRSLLRGTLVTDNGAGGWTATFESSDDGETWTQFGDDVTGSGVTSLFATGTDYMIGGYIDSGLGGQWTGRMYYVEFRDGPAGTLMASPDFTGYPAGTQFVTDSVANIWSINVPATIESGQVMTSVAILGPLETDECATYEDFTLPRTGIAGTCDHPAEECCSYYRARTLGRIDGQLQISDWSDAFDPAIPLGVVSMWPGTEASIPSGWNRVTNLDSRYPKSIPNSSTEPGTNGGSASHSHILPTHNHDTSHLHTAAANTASATGTVNAPNTAGALKALTTHTHSRPSTASATVVSGSTIPTTGTANNDPDRLEVIYIEPDGTPRGVPDQALGLMGDISPSGWSTYTDATGRYLRGAAAASNGGATVASTVANHTHAIDNHTHTGTSHTHTSANTGNFSSTLAPATGSGSVTSAATHNHPITIGINTSSSLASGGSGTSDATSPADLDYCNLRVRRNVSGDVSLPVGLICLWQGHVGVVPRFWQLCDGTNGTPNMFGRYVKGATSSIGGTGGASTSHTHTSPTHTHTTTGHAHTSTTSVTTAGSTTASTTATVAIATAAHTHVTTDVDSTTPTVAASSSGTLVANDTEPPFRQVAFIQLMEDPVAPPDPDVFCLTWDDDQHLIRTQDEDGPMFVAIGGVFTWDRDRPFTAATGVMGSRFVTSAEPGGRNLHLATAVESESDLADLMAVLSRPLVLVSPSDSAEVWAAPVLSSVRVIKIGRVRQVSADFIATGPQPAPQLADVGV